MPANLDCILAMDTATGPCSVAVWHKGDIAAYVETAKPVMQQSARLVPMIEDALRQSHTTYGDVTAVAATVGPGSFTGIRVALAAARAICFARRIPCMGYTSLQVLAYAAAKDKPTLAVLNAGKGEHYFQYFKADPWQPLGEPQLGLLEDALAGAPAGDVWLSGNAQADDARFTATDVTFPRADWLARLAAQHPTLASKSLRPFYIRPPDAKLPPKKIQAKTV